MFLLGKECQRAHMRGTYVWATVFVWVIYPAIAYAGVRTFVHARGEYPRKILAFTDEAVEPIWEGGHLAYGSAHGQIAIICGTHLTVFDPTSGQIVRKHLLTDRVMMMHGGQDELLAFGDKGKTLYYVTIRVPNDAPRGHHEFFLNCIDIATGETKTVAPLSDFKIPLLVELPGAIGAYCQVTGALATYSEDRDAFELRQPKRRRDLPVQRNQGKPRYFPGLVYVDQVGIIETMITGTFQKIADPDFNLLDSQVNQQAAPFLKARPVQVIRWKGSPALACGLSDESNNRLQAIRVVAPLTFQELWNQEVPYEARTFSFSRDGRYLSVLNVDDAALLTYDLDNEQTVRRQPVPPEYRKGLSDAQIIPIR